MGLWMIQSVRHETGDRYSWEDLTEMARASITFPAPEWKSITAAFWLPENMTERSCVPIAGRRLSASFKSVGETASVVYQSLAGDYVRTASEMERLTGKKILHNLHRRRWLKSFSEPPDRYQKQ